MYVSGYKMSSDLNGNAGFRYTYKVREIEEGKEVTIKRNKEIQPVQLPKRLGIYCEIYENTLKLSNILAAQIKEIEFPLIQNILTFEDL
jgi:hypothetical protein